EKLPVIDERPSGEARVGDAEDGQHPHHPIGQLTQPKMKVRVPGAVHAVVSTPTINAGPFVFPSAGALDPCDTHNSRDETAKLSDCKTPCMLLMSAQVPCSPPMDASPAELGIHGHNGDKNRVYSIGCHGCPDSPKMGIHEGIHGGQATVSPHTPSAGR